ncbi:MAG TPA: hypothetical protein DF783_04290 [Acidimicrobiaceae bacterium]|nr:hypothetical protein [Acidobacteriota bacterium]HCV36125.1 hypothetical protein [Acidimicrobiaceae bacterium]HJO79590.1 hypothetical protein [Acidimicrobiales bacterium]
MPRIEIELTSSRDDGSWTWRAAGAREPRGTLDGSLLPTGAAVGDQLRAETEQFLDGLEITALLLPKAGSDQPDLLEILGSGRNEPQVITTLAKKGRSGRKGESPHSDDKPRGRRRDGKDGKGRRKERGERSQSTRSDGETGSSNKKKESSRRRSRKGATASPSTATEGPPKPKRLRPRRKHRKAALAALPEELHLIGQILARGGIPGLRDTVEAQNKAALEAGEPEIPTSLLVQLGERIYPSLRTADWHDRAEAALTGIAEVDLRDLRSVVVASDTAARSDETRELAGKLREELATRVDREHTEWMNEVRSTLDSGRIVRALRLSSRPPKAGAPLPPAELDRLAEAANASLTSQISQDRWATIIDAVALSPVHLRVVPEGLPAEPAEELLEVVRRVSMNVPDVASSFGIKPAPTRRSRRPRRPTAF